MAVGDIFQVNINWSVYGQRLMNVLHYRCTAVDGAPTRLAQQTELLNVLFDDTAFLADLRNATPQDVSLYSVSAQAIEPVRVRATTQLKDLPGLIEQDANTSNVCAVITKYTDFATRNQIGAMHIPIGGGPMYVADGLLAAGQVTVIDAVALHLTDPVVGALNNDYAPVIFHRARPNIPAGYDYLTATRTQLTARVMTRRTVGRGI